jgi:hypothetical protein
MAINTGKVISGGLLTGFVYNVFDMLWNFTVLQADGLAMAARLNLNPAVITDFSYQIPWIVIDFVLGLLTIFIYAGFRPRFGAGPKTAVIAGFMPWVAITSVVCGFAWMGVFTEALVIKASLLTIVNVVVGSIAGAWAYQE